MSKTFSANLSLRPPAACIPANRLPTVRVPGGSRARWPCTGVPPGHLHSVDGGLQDTASPFLSRDVLHHTSHLAGSLLAASPPVPAVPAVPLPRRLRSPLTSKVESAKPGRTPTRGVRGGAWRGWDATAVVGVLGGVGYPIHVSNTTPAGGTHTHAHTHTAPLRGRPPRGGLSCKSCARWGAWPGLAWLCTATARGARSARSARGSRRGG